MNLHISSKFSKYLDYDNVHSIYHDSLDFNWDDQGKYLLENIVIEKIDVIQKELDYIMNLTSKSVKNIQQVVDTTKLRNVMRCYVELIFGIFNKDFDYSKMNHLVKREAKGFIKIIACHSGTVEISKDCIASMKSLYNFQEIFHIIYYTCWVKNKVQLTYFSKYFNKIK